MLSLLAETTQYVRFEDLPLSEGIALPGGFMLRFYSLAYLAGIILGYWHLTRMIKAPGSPMAQRHADDLFFYSTLGIILGGRLGYALFYKPELFVTFTEGEFVSWNLLRLWDGGMSFHGGVLGVLAGIAYLAWRDKLSFLRISDYIAVNVPFGMMFGRLANFVNGELWGRTTDVPWAIVFPGAGELPRHPSQLYEAALEGALLIAVLLYMFWRTRARYRPGLLVGTFTFGIALGRFTVEFFREPDAHLADVVVDTGLSQGQWLTIPLILIGLGVMIFALRKPPLGTHVQTSAAQVADLGKPV